MKKLGEMMSELGFREEAPTAVKEAFIKHLIKAAYNVEVETPTEKNRRALGLGPVINSAQHELEKNRVKEPEQMSFDFSKPDQKVS